MKVVVLGAGIIGASIADELTRRGVSVTVLDMRPAGQGATQASAGMLAPYAEAHSDPHLLDLGIRSLSLFDRYVAELRDATGMRIEYSRNGTLEVALTDADTVRLLDARRALEAAGVPCEWIEGRGCGQFEPTLTSEALAGLFTPDHGLVGVHSLLAAIVQRARFAGAIFESPVEAVGVEGRPSGVEIRTGDRQIAADAVVIATGSWSRRVRVANVAPIPTKPVRGQLLQLQWTGRLRPRRVVWGPSCYAVPWDDGSLLVGATVEEAGFDESPTVAGVQQLMSAALELLPDVRTARVDRVRVGLRPSLPDGLPAIGPLARASGVVVATGHYRNGVLFAPLTAAVVTRYIVDGVEDEIFGFTSPNRFTAMEAYS